MKATVSFDFKKQATEARIKKRLVQIQGKLDLEVLKNANLFVPEDEAFLKDSGVLGSKIGSGQLEWDSPYARAQYYSLPNKSKDKNPRASMKWFEVAKSKYKDVWIKLSNGWYAG